MLLQIGEKGKKLLKLKKIVIYDSLLYAKFNNINIINIQSDYFIDINLNLLIKIFFK